MEGTRGTWETHYAEVVRNSKLLPDEEAGCVPKNGLQDPGGRQPAQERRLGGIDGHEPGQPSPCSVMDVLRMSPGIQISAQTTQRWETSPSAADEDMEDEPTTPTEDATSWISYATPSGSQASECPQTPQRSRRTPMRTGSLSDTKLLATTAVKLARQDSSMFPEAFRFDDHFHYVGIVGRSQTSEVYAAMHKEDGTLYAVKKSLHEFKGYADRKRWLREVECVERLPAHPHIVTYYRGWQQDMRFYIQMEYCQGGSLRNVLDHMQGSTLLEEDIWTIGYQVASGLAFIHDNGVLHLDIKPDNIFISADGTYKIGDFGIAITNAYEDWEEGDGAYLAPELLNDLAEPTTAADMYSLGAMLYECATGTTLPRSCLDREKITTKVQLPGRSEALSGLLQYLLASAPQDRPTASELTEVINQLYQQG